MCLACEMEQELWAAYFEQLAQREKAEGVQPSKVPTETAAKAEAAPAFVCEEQPSE